MRVNRTASGFLILAAMAACHAAGAAEVADVPWARPPLASITATNPAADATDDVSPYEAALRMLDAPADAGTNTAAAGEFSVSSIMKLEPERGEDWDETVDRGEEESARQIIEEANELARTGDSDTAIQLLLSVLPDLRRPQVRASIYGRIGHFYFRQNKIKDAAEYMRLALDNRPSDPRLVSNLAAALLTLGQMDEAESLLKGINLALEFDNGLLFVVHFNMACISSMKGDIETGMTNLEKAAQAAPASALASLGDPQIDALRNSKRFVTLRSKLELAAAASQGETPP